MQKSFINIFIINFVKEPENWYILYIYYCWLDDCRCRNVSCIQ